MALDSLYELLMEELKDMYHAENQLLSALPKMARAAGTAGLRKMFENHLLHTEDQVCRLEQVFAELGVAPRGKRCKPLEGMLESGSDLLKYGGKRSVIDAALVSMARRIAHYEIAAYSSLVGFAERLGEEQVAAVLRLSLEEDTAANDTLARLAEDEVNGMAVAAGVAEDTDS